MYYDQEYYFTYNMFHGILCRHIIKTSRQSQEKIEKCLRNKMISDLNKPDTVLEYALIISTRTLELKWQLY